MKRGDRFGILILKHNRLGRLAISRKLGNSRTIFSKYFKKPDLAFAQVATHESKIKLDPFADDIVYQDLRI